MWRVMIVLKGYGVKKRRSDMFVKIKNTIYVP